MSDKNLEAILEIARNQLHHFPWCPRIRLNDGSLGKYFGAYLAETGRKAYDVAYEILLKLRPQDSKDICLVMTPSFDVHGILRPECDHKYDIVFVSGYSPDLGKV